MSVQPLEDVLSELEHDEPCNCECDVSATWLIWVSHARNGDTGPAHCERCVHVCEVHRKWVEEQVLLKLNASPCTCGYRYNGQLSDHFRAIRL